MRKLKAKLYPSLKWCIPLSLICFTLFSCNPGDSESERRRGAGLENDRGNNARDTTFRDDSRQNQSAEDSLYGRKINVDGPAFEPEDWEALKNAQSLDEDGVVNHSFGGNPEVASAISPVYLKDNQEYQIVYTYFDNEVRIKMRLLGEGDDPIREFTAKQQADQQNYGNIWMDMEQRIRALEDSLSKSRR